MKFYQHSLCFFLTSFFQSLSVMVHGETLTSLVSQAENGNDDAFVKAVQIDRRILLVRPYFKDKFISVQSNGDQNFYDRLSYRLQSPPFKGKIKHKTLWLAFSMLDQAGLLRTLKHKDILELLDEAGVTNSDKQIASVKHLSSRLTEYYEFQKRSSTTTK